MTRRQQAATHTFDQSVERWRSVVAPPNRARIPTREEIIERAAEMGRESARDTHGELEPIKSMRD